MTTMERATADLPQRSNLYKIGWWFLVLITAASLLNHTIGALGIYGDDQLVFFGYAALNVYALAVFIVGYRRRERWAWWTTWAFVASYALAIFDAPVVGLYYLGTAVLMALAQLSTWSAFRQS